jgi:hypothetical protein
MDIIPFAFNAYAGDDGEEGSTNWLPAMFSQLLRLCRLVQACHMWLLFLGTGPRSSTLTSYTTDCLVTSPNGYRLVGTEFKKPSNAAGQSKDWSLAPALVCATRQQIRMATLVKSMNGTSASARNNLWVQFKGRSKSKNASDASFRGDPLYDITPAITLLVDSLGLRGLLGADANPHTHRFRKTLARILALSLTNAQTVLMDCFGHDDPDVTLGYMLSDRTIVADALRVQREMVILMARDAVLNVENLGGPLATTLKQSVYTFVRLKGHPKLTPQDAYELADQLTLGGREWVFVMEGVICTLPQFDSGPCSLGRGSRRSPANCQPHCSHQLILGHYKNRTNDMIAYLIDQLERAEADCAQMLVASLVGQLKNHLGRWSDVTDKWKNHPIVSRYIVTADVV